MPATNLGMLGPAFKITGTPGTSNFSGNVGIVQKFRQGDTVNIPSGVPVFMAFAGNTYDGLDCVLPSTAQAQNSNNFIFVGVTVGQNTTPNVVGTAPGQPFDVVVDGVYWAARVEIASRAATTSPWPAFGGATVGDLLSVDLVNNLFARSAAGAITGGVGFLGQSLATLATQASNYSSSAYSTAANGLALYQLAKVYLRKM